MGEHEIRRGGLVDHCLVREAAPRVLGKRHPLLRRIRDEVSGLGELLFRHLELDSAGLHGVDVSRFAARTFRCLRVRLGGAIVVRQPADLRCRVVFFRVVFETVLVIVLGAVFGLDRRIRVVALAWTNWAFVRAVAGFAAFVAYLGFHSRAVVSVVSLRFERAFAIGALVVRTREALSACVSRAAAFAASYLSTFGC